MENLELDVAQEQLKKYLETSISDSLIFNSFISDLVIFKIGNKYADIGISVEYGLNLINKQYLVDFNIAIKEITQKDINVKLFLKKDYIESYKKQNVINTSKRKEKEVNFAVDRSSVSDKYTFDNYVLTEFNRQAANAVKKSIDSIGMFNPLFIYSKSGMGKTHLLQAGGNYALDNGYEVKYISPNKFTNMVTSAVAAGHIEIEKLKSNFIDTKILLIDDIQLLGNRDTTIQVLFDIFNELISSNKQIILVADRTPDELLGFQDRFITRFGSGLTLSLNEPTVEGYIKIIQKKIQEMDLQLDKWDDDALAYVARTSLTSVRALESSLTRIKYLASDEPVNVRFTYDVVKGYFTGVKADAKTITPDRIIQVVADYYNLTKSNITGKSRKEEITQARHISMWLIRQITKLSYKNIGKQFSNRDHSTVLNAIEKINAHSRIKSSLATVLKILESKVMHIE
ncbi:MAG: chromosomal replication initiator protein DnaA [Mycoplasma sp.]|nr:chromosomal replication initiator protein DnaA [Mycoplasma sp.]